MHSIYAMSFFPIALTMAVVAAMPVSAMAQDAAGAPEIVSVVKIWDAGAHNAFTDLIRFQERWYCTFREGDDHVGGDGKIRVLVSEEGDAWQSAALITEPGIDLRDPKLSIAPDGRLMIVAGGSVYEGKTLMGRQPRVCFSTGGREWTPPRRVLEEGEWLWRVTWHKGQAYGVSYSIVETEDRKDWRARLFRSEDGVAYEFVATLEVPDRPNETTLRFAGDEMIALVRRESGDAFGWIGTSQPPYTDWIWYATQHRLGGPNFIVLPDGAMWAGSREYPGGAKMAIARMGRAAYEPVLTLPSGGDCSYPGLVWHEGLLWVSYYSSHEGKTSIYLARIRLPQS